MKIKKKKSFGTFLIIFGLFLVSLQLIIAENPYIHPYKIKSVSTDYIGNPIASGGFSPLFKKGISFQALRNEDRNILINNGVGQVLLAFHWPTWEDTDNPVSQQSECNLIYGENAYFYNGKCYYEEPAVTTEIETYSNEGIEIVGLFVGVPYWARKVICAEDYDPNTGLIGDNQFCSTENPEDLVNYVGAIASKYSNIINKYILHNEIDHMLWYNPGCDSSFGACDFDFWVEEYSQEFIAAYDKIAEYDNDFIVLLPVTGNLEGDECGDITKTRACNPGEIPHMNVKRFLTTFAPKVGDRKWSVALHVYGKNFDHRFSPDDYFEGLSSFGSYSAFAGWLRLQFPNKEYIWSDISLTEEGITSHCPAGLCSAQTQSNALCEAFTNVLGTPETSYFLYHRMVDHPHEVELANAGGVVGHNFGLYEYSNPIFDGENTWYQTISPKEPTWSTWALSNQPGVSGGLNCGFEALPFLRLTRHYSPVRGHWASTRIPPKDFSVENTFFILRYPYPDTIPLYECGKNINSGNLITKNINECGLAGLPLFGSVGYIFNSQKNGTIPVYRCHLHVGDHMISSSDNCEVGFNAATNEGILGYAYPENSELLSCADDNTNGCMKWDDDFDLHLDQEFGGDDCDDNNPNIFAGCQQTSLCSLADTSLDSVVDIGELISYISIWKSGSIVMDDLLTAIGEWKNGC